MIPEKRVYILSGAIGSGKTTRLLDWSAERKDVYGILTPVINGKRVFMDVHSREQFAMEVGADETAVITVGKFVFSQPAFEKAKKIIRNSGGKTGWLIIDEIGPLELRNEGFAGVLKEAIDSVNNEQKILLVVREGLLEKVKEKFGINKVIMISTIGLF
jgi:nucleoside-triphosphatase THEP1